MNVVETEFHFLLVGQFYRELRKQYFSQYYCRWPSIHKFKQLMICTSSKGINNVAAYVYHATMLRG